MDNLRWVLLSLLAFAGGWFLVSIRAIAERVEPLLPPITVESEETTRAP